MTKPQIISISKPKSLITEAYRNLKNNIQLSSLEKELKIIMIASAGSNEGRTLTASNLAVVMAESGKKTILIDCDQRKSNIHNLFGFSNEKGLSNILLGQMIFDEIEWVTNQNELYVIPSGPKTINYAELLSLDKLSSFLHKLKEKFDYIIIDTPPLTMVRDAQIISKYVDGCVYVVGVGEVDKKNAIQGKEILDKVSANILGVVFNKTDLNSKRFFLNYYGRKNK
ncbi:CpsD/CapB family tyrosine-protein kinase [Clostridium bowmanii]|uniref:CpsD/CapB family tyrosine-protein kinase n=1 Tax=Clostridium bowmanii TaxID=132925 RepID=UPI001C0E5EFE|nr:CpsD/CapB family tyrosine-protein kinase [Clostridium bowmanii]MBU3191235.1 CpsD/CapB family tyrosine-protein kinase [Clostridium bowmanii]MCA1075683.1 CpsD/CapB family tyrosine-protein kinase [Clostridium bowmanii]